MFRDHVSKEVWKTIVCHGLNVLENIAEESKKHGKTFPPLFLNISSVSARSTPSPALGESSRRVPHITNHTLRVELWKLFSALTKCSKGKEELIVTMKTRTEAIIAEHFQSVESFRLKMTASKEDGIAKKKYMTQKRRLEQQNQQDVTQQLKMFVPSAAPPVLTPQKPSSNTISSVFTAAAAQAASAASATASTSYAGYQPLSDSDDDIQCIDPPPPKKPAQTLPQRQLNASAPTLIAQVPPKVPARPIIQPPRTANPPTINKAPLKPVVAPKPIIASKPMVSKPVVVAKPIPKPVPKPIPKPTPTTTAPVNPIAAFAAAANASGTDPMTALLAAAMSADPAQQRIAAEAIKTIQAQQLSMQLQNAQFQALAVAAVQMQAQAAQNQKAAIARPTAVRPAATAVVGRQTTAPRVSLPSTSAAVNPPQLSRQSLPHRPPANTVRPPFTQNATQRTQPTVPVRPIPTRPSLPSASTASIPNQLIRPNAVRPTAPSASRPVQNASHNIARPIANRPQANAQPGPNGQSAEGRANVIQFLNSITDPAERNRMMRLLLVSASLADILSPLIFQQ